jgi:hypothetical protein
MPFSLIAVQRPERKDKEISTKNKIAIIFSFPML